MSLALGRGRPTAVYLLDSESLDLIYGPEERKEIAKLASVLGPPLTEASIASKPTNLYEAELIISGWGAPQMDASFLDLAPKLRAVLYGAGSVRGMVTPEFFARGVRVTSAVAGNAIPVAHYTTATIIFSLKNGWRLMQSRDAWPSGPDRHVAPGTFGPRVGLVGLGAIGRIVHEHLRFLDFRVVVHDPYLSTSQAADMGIELLALDELFASCDVISLHMPLNASTRGMIDGRRIASMPAGGTLINTARGAVIRQDELAEVLVKRRDLQAVLDVTDPEPLPKESGLLTLANVILTPHIAGSQGPECRRLGQMMVDELRRYVAGEPFRWQVDPNLMNISA